MDHRSSRDRRRRNLGHCLKRRSDRERLDSRRVGEEDFVDKRTLSPRRRRDSTPKDISAAEATHIENEQGPNNLFVRQWLDEIEPQHGLPHLYSDIAYSRDYALDASRKRLACSPMPLDPAQLEPGAISRVLEFHDGRLVIRNDLGRSDEPISHDFRMAEDLRNERFRAERSYHKKRKRSPSPAFERRPRHKTRQDRYDAKDATRSSKSRSRREKSLQPQRRQAPKKKPMPSGRHIMENFTSDAVLNNRVTLQPSSLPGLFRNGRVSAPKEPYTSMDFLARPGHAGLLAKSPTKHRLDGKPRREHELEEVANFFGHKQQPELGDQSEETQSADGAHSRRNQLLPFAGRSGGGQFRQYDQSDGLLARIPPRRQSVQSPETTNYSPSTSRHSCHRVHIKNGARGHDIQRNRDKHSPVPARLQDGPQKSGFLRRASYAYGQRTSRTPQPPSGRSKSVEQSDVPSEIADFAEIGQRQVAANIARLPKIIRYKDKGTMATEKSVDGQRTEKKLANSQTEVGSGPANSSNAVVQCCAETGQPASPELTKPLVEPIEASATRPDGPAPQTHELLPETNQTQRSSLNDVQGCKTGRPVIDSEMGPARKSCSMNSAGSRHNENCNQHQLPMSDDRDEFFCLRKQETGDAYLQKTAMQFNGGIEGSRDIISEPSPPIHESCTALDLDARKTLAASPPAGSLVGNTCQPTSFSNAAHRSFELEQQRARPVESLDDFLSRVEGEVYGSLAPNSWPLDCRAHVDQQDFNFKDSRLNRDHVWHASSEHHGKSHDMERSRNTPTIRERQNYAQYSLNGPEEEESAMSRFWRPNVWM